MYDLWVYQALVKAFAFLPWKTQFLHPFQGIWFNSVQKSRITQTGKEVQERTQSFHQNFKLTILLSLFAICNVGISAHASLLATSDVPILFSALYLVSLKAPNGRTRFSHWEQIGIIPVMRHYMSQPRHLVQRHGVNRLHYLPILCIKHKRFRSLSEILLYDVWPNIYLIAILKNEKTTIHCSQVAWCLIITSRLTKLPVYADNPILSVVGKMI